LEIGQLFFELICAGLHVLIEHFLGQWHKARMCHPSAIMPCVRIGMNIMDGNLNTIPSDASRSLSFLTAPNAASLAAWSCLIGIWAAIPPMAKIPR
jgi:hypothetical protein